jgi:hypothetical protein
MLFRLFTAVCLVASMSFVSQLAHAQKVANYDLTDAKPLERLRPPVPTSPLPRPATRDRLHPPPPPKPTLEESGEGVCGGILATQLLEVSILSLDRDSYAFGDEFTFVLRLKAIYPTRVPVRASMAEIEPSDPNVSYEWRSMWLSLELQSSTHRTVGVGIGLPHLYGSKDTPGSEIDLKAGEWIELRGKARMKWANSPHGTLPASKEKYVLRLPLKSAQEFDARAYAMRGEGYRYDAASRKETRVCHPAEHSSGVDPVHITITPSPNS